MYREYLANSKLMPTLAPPEKKISKEKLRQAARQQFMESVSMAGLIEFYHAPSRPIRIMWLLALLASFGSIFYHSDLLIGLYSNQKPEFDVIQTDTQTIPFPKVVVCSSSGINKTWAAEHIRFPPREKKMFDRMDPTEKKDLIEKVSALLANSFEYVVDHSVKPANPSYFMYHRILIETYKNLPNGSWTDAVIDNGVLPSCENTVSNCRLAGRAYNCCENSFLQVGDNGPCFDLNVSWHVLSINFVSRYKSIIDL